MSLTFGLRNLSRARQIISVLVLDYGFGYIFDQLDLGRLLPLGRRRGPGRKYAGLSGAERLRLALSELGPTFIKLGQVLSARPDLLSPAAVAELRKLQDEVPAAPFEEVRGTIESELGQPLEQCFARFDATPLSAASLGQVYAAALHDGREVTVKALRPGVRSVVEADLQLLADAAQLLHRQVPGLQRYHLPSFARQFADQLEDQMLYTLEARNGERLRRIVEGAHMRVRIPAVIWDFTTRRVLTTERLHGRKVDRLWEAPRGLDRPAAARELGRCLLHQMFVEGLFHGDPHQGNVLLADDGTVLLLDCGLVGYLDPRTRRLLAEMVWKVYEEDIDGLVTVMSELGGLGPETDLAALRSDMARIVSRFMILPRRDFPIGELLSRALRALWLNHVRVPPELALAAKALLMAEGVCFDLDPDFDFRELVKPVAAEVRASLLSPSAIADRVLKAVSSSARHLGKLPARVDSLLSRLEHGSLRLRVEDPNAEGRSSRLAQSLNRLSLSVLSGALLIGSAIYLAGARNATQVGLGVAALVGAVLVGLIVLLAVLRPGRV